MCKSEPCKSWHWCSVPVCGTRTYKETPKRRAQLKSGEQKWNHSRRQITSHPFRTAFEGTGEELANANPRPHCASKPWSYRLHNIIKQFKLDILMQGINTRVSQGKNPIRATPPPSPPPSHGSLPLVSLFSICRLITIKVFFTPCQGSLRGIRLFRSFQGRGCRPAVHPISVCRGTARGRAWEAIFTENRKSVKADGGILSMIAAFELFNTNAELLLVLGGGGLLGISKRRWGKNITVQIEPWVLNLKNEMNYSWIITPGSDCANTNCERWWSQQTHSKHNTFKM